MTKKFFALLFLIAICFHILLDGETGGYIEGKYLDILSEQEIYK